MLSFLIVLYALIGAEGKAFPSVYKSYEGSYHYIPFEEGIVQIPAGYSPENLPNYQVHGYVQTNGHDWSAYYHEPMLSQPMQHPYSNTNGHHKMKSKHNWHFIDPNHVPVTRYTDGMHQFESDVEAPNVVEAKKDVIDRHDSEYDAPIVISSLIGKDDPEIPAVVDSLAVKEKPTYSERNKIVTEPPFPYYMHESIKDVPFISTNELKLPVMVYSLKKDKPVKVEPAASYNLNEHIKSNEDVLVRRDERNELPVVVDSLSKRGKPVKVEPAAIYNIYEPIKEDPVSYETVDNSLGFESLNKVEDLEHEAPIVIEALVRKEKPTFNLQEEHELPAAVEALVRKQHPAYENKKQNMEEEKTLPKDLLHLAEEDVEKLAIPVVEAPTFEQYTETNETPKQKGISFDETHGFKGPEMDNFDEDGSGMNFDRSRSFFTANSNIFSMVTNIKEQERRKFKNCVTPKNESGNCMPFQLCSVSSMVTSIDELLRNVCIIDEVFIGICCPEFPVETVRVDWEQLKPDAEKLNEEESSEISKECGRLPSRATDRNQWPWMASLIAKSSDKIFCGGALVTKQYVLTAAHCTIRIPRNQILVRLGRPASENRPEPDYEVIEIKRHAGYNSRTMQNDIALLKLSRRVQFGDLRRVICLAKEEALVGKSASLLHWKETLGEMKDVSSLTVISTQECQRRMRTAIADSILCTEPRTDETMCNADSGAPLITIKDEKFEVIGILTWNRNDCDERFPAVFARVSSYHGWIEKLAS